MKKKEQEKDESKFDHGEKQLSTSEVEVAPSSSSVDGAAEEK